MFDDDHADLRNFAARGGCSGEPAPVNQQEQFWSGSEGDAYLARNRVRWHDRASFWASILDITKAQNILEVGCNAGWNLRAINHVHGLGWQSLTGVDINAAALQEAQATLTGCFLQMPANAVGDFYQHNQQDLVFTAGVLIHVGPDELEATMRSIIQASRRYVLAIEYAAEKEEGVLYRGHTERLWRRPFGKLYEALGLAEVASGDAGPGFDRCTYWLLRKPEEKP